MKDEPKGPYVYQPFGAVTHPELARIGRLWAIGGIPWPMMLAGLTLEEAQAIVASLRNGGSDDQK